MMPESALPVVTLIVGGALGFISSILLSFAQKRHQIVLRLLDQYLVVRNEVVEAVSELTHLGNHAELAPQDLSRYGDLTAKLFYKHYDVLPQPVLDALLLLHIALDHRDGQLYTIKDNTIGVLATSEVPSFIVRNCLYQNAALIAPLALMSSDKTVRVNQALKLHARHVLITLNAFASIDRLNAMTREFRKLPRLM